MTVGWQTRPIGEVFRIVSGGTPKTNVASYWGGDHLWITPAEMSGLESPFLTASRRKLTNDGLRVGAELLPENSIILSTRAPIGHLVINEAPMAFNQGCKGLVPQPGIDTKFAYYFLLANVPLLDNLGTGATFKELSGAKLKEVLFHFPPLSVQRRIVAILDETFEGIATARANAEKNLQNARELFASRMHLLFQRNDAWERVQLADLLTRGWITGHLDGNHGSDYPRKEEFVDVGVPYIAASAIRNGVIDFTEAKYLSPHRAASIRKGLAKDRDVLFAHNATVGPVAILHTDENVVILGTSLTYYRCDPQHVHPEYLAHFMVSPAFTSQYELVMKQSTRNQVPITKQREFFHVIPPIEVQRRIADELDELETQTDRLCDLHERKLLACDELKKSLLHQAFTGQLTSPKQTRVAPKPALQPTTPEFAANVISIAYARHERQQREKTFGRVKEQKVLHLAESIAGIDMGRQPMKDAAGPNDFQHMLKAEEWAWTHNFFEMVKRDGGYDFKKLSAFDEHLSRAHQALAPYLPQLESVIDILVPMDKTEVEVFATVHAAWNNLLIEGAEVTDAAMVSAAREHWHADKLDIPEGKFHEAIAQIRQKGVVPDGTAKYVGGQQRLI